MNRARIRDAETNALLRAAGWEVLRFWEDEDLEAAAEAAADKIAALRSLRQNHG